MKNCPECGSEKIIRDDARVIYPGGGNEIQIVVEEDPGAFMLKKRVSSTMNPEICADCGFVAFYAREAKMLWTAYQNRQKNI